MPKIENKTWWIGIAIIFKTLLFFLLLYLKGIDITTGKLYHITGDTPSYIEPIENLLTNGTYSFRDEIYAGRMPGYGVIYLLFRLFAGYKTALNCLILAQLLVSAISVYYLAKASYLIFKQKPVFFLTYFIYLISTYISIYDYMLITESFGAASLIFSFYFIVKYIVSNPSTLLSLFLSGVFLTWAVFLRAVISPVFIIFTGLLLLLNYQKPLKKNILMFFTFLIPFIVCEGLWTYRNYYQFKAFYPLQSDIAAGYNYNDSFLELSYLCQAWGLSIISWNPKAEIRWFDEYIGRSSRIFQANRYDVPNTNPFPEYIYTSYYNLDSLILLRKYVQMATDTNLSLSQRNFADNIAAVKAKSYKEHFILEKPFYYYVYTPIVLIKKFLFHSGTYSVINNPLHTLNIRGKLCKLVVMIHYWLVLLFGLLGLWLLVKTKSILPLLVAILCIYLIMIFPLGFRKTEYRYLAVAYPFLLVSACYFIHQMWKQYMSFMNRNAKNEQQMFT